MMYLRPKTPTFISKEKPNEKEKDGFLVLTWEGAEAEGRTCERPVGTVRRSGSCRWAPLGPEVTRAEIPAQFPVLISLWRLKGYQCLSRGPCSWKRLYRPRRQHPGTVGTRKGMSVSSKSESMRGRECRP